VSRAPAREFCGQRSSHFQFFSKSESIYNRENDSRWIVTLQCRQESEWASSESWPWFSATPSKIAKKLTVESRPLKTPQIKSRSDTDQRQLSAIDERLRQAFLYKRRLAPFHEGRNRYPNTAKF